MIRTLVSSSSELPIGSIISFNGGYFTGINSGFTNVLGNTISDINNYVSKYGFRVCDGSVPNDPSSPVFNSSSRYLPNLTDDRFLQGKHISGSIGGSNTVLDHTHTISIPGHSHSVVNSYNNTHGHYIDIYGGTTGGRYGTDYGNPTSYGPNSDGWTVNGTWVTHVAYTNFDSSLGQVDDFYDGTDGIFRRSIHIYRGPSNNDSVYGYVGSGGNAGRSGDSGFSITSTVGTTSSVSNVPKYLDLVFIIRIK